MSRIKSELEECYISKWSDLKKAIRQLDQYEKLPAPHLLSVTEKFEKKWNDADLKIMLFGMSTNGWNFEKDYDNYLEDDKGAIEKLMKFYENWAYGGGNWAYGQVFWNYFYAFEELLNYKLGKKVAFAWNNVYKIEQSQQAVEQENFNCTVEEINIFRPNVIMLMGADTRNILHYKLSQEKIDWVAHEQWQEISEKDNGEFLYYSVDGDKYDSLKASVKKLIVTYHPNARGASGIKMKLMMDKLVPELKELNF